MSKSNRSDISAAEQRQLIATMVADGEITDPDSPRGRLLYAAASLFEQKGYARTTVRDIAAEVGILSGSIFHHFPNKEGILCSVMEEVTEVVRVRMEYAVASQERAREKLLACIRSELEAIHGLTVPGFSLLVSEWRNLSAANQKRVLARRDRYEAVWLRVLEAVAKEAQGHGSESLPDPALVRKLLLGALAHTHSWFRPRSQGGLSVSQLAEQVSRVFAPARIST